MSYPRLFLAAFLALIVFFAWGFLTEGWLLLKAFQPSGALYRTADIQLKYMPFGLAAVFVALLTAAAVYAEWCHGTSGALKGVQFGLLMGLLVACVHPISNLVTMKMDLKLGLLTTVTAFLGWVLVGLVFGLIYRPVTA